ESTDGYVADARGNSRWITSERARAHGHLLRARYDAILVGMGTARVDDPMLTCRLPGLESRSPLRVVLETQLQLSPESQLGRTAKQHPTLVFTAAKYVSDMLSGLGVEIVQVIAEGKGRPDVLAVLQALAKRGITRVLVEGGPTLHASFLARGLVDL